MSHHLAASGIQSGIKKSIPGLHIVANLGCHHNEKLISSQAFRKFINSEIEHHDLTKLGEVYHEFPIGGYTAVICLSESHISVHTWPEHNYLTFDIFLSNQHRNNRETTITLFEQVKEFFDADILLEKFIDR